MRKTAPGKNGASTKPRKNRTTTSCEKFCVAALQADTAPHNAMAEVRYSDGRSFVISRFDGSCIRRYPTKKMEVARLKSVLSIPRSSSNEPCRAWARLARSRKLRRYIRMRNGSRCRSIFRRSFFSYAFWVASSWVSNLVTHGLVLGSPSDLSTSDFCSMLAFSVTTGGFSSAMVSEVVVLKGVDADSHSFKSGRLADIYR